MGEVRRLYVTDETATELATVEVETQIITMVVQDAIRAGYSVAVSDGHGNDKAPKSRTLANVMDSIHSGEDDYLVITRHDKNAGCEVRIGWVYLKYGQGVDVIDEISSDEETLNYTARARAYAKGAEEA